METLYIKLVFILLLCMCGVLVPTFIAKKNSILIIPVIFTDSLKSVKIRGVNAS